MRAFAVSLALVAALPAAAEEQTVELMSGGQPFVGTLALPEGDPAPVVLLLHGFGGSRNELATDHVSEGVFAYMAGRLMDAGFASLRIDFRGSGESTADLSFADTTFDGQTQDAAAAIDFLKSSNAVASDDIHVIGWSQGGLVAAALASQAEGLDTVSLWNAVGDPKATYETLFGADMMATGFAAAPDETLTMTLPWGVDISLKGAFFDGIETQDPMADIAGYSGPLFVAVGSQDTTVLPENGTRFIEAHDGPEVLWSADMDHVFNVFGTGDMLTELADETIAFMNAHAD